MQAADLPGLLEIKLRQAGTVLGLMEVEVLEAQAPPVEIIMLGRLELSPSCRRRKPGRLELSLGC